MPKPKLAKVTSLEFLTRAWGDCWYLVELRERLRAATKQPPLFEGRSLVVENHRHFRPFLLGKQPLGKTLTIHDFDAPKVWEAAYWSSLHYALAGWCAKSRRVYRLDGALQKVLENTTLGDMTWADIPYMPFDAFAIELAVPITTGSGKPCDVLLVNVGSGEIPWTFAAIRSDLRDYKQVDREWMEKLLRPTNRARLADEITSHLSAITAVGGISWMMSVRNKQERMLTSLENSIEKAWKLSDRAKSQAEMLAVPMPMLSIALGLPLYLASLPTKLARETRVEQEGTTGQICFASGKLDPRAVSAEAEIFTVNSRLDLSPLERVFFGLEGTEDEQRAVRDWVKANSASCHWQPGFFRRRPGFGQDPSAPRCVHVKPHLTGKDCLPPFALPGGTAATVK